MIGRVVAAALLMVLSGTGAGQMMGSQLSTSGYFPLVDGARYDYVFTRGPWATSTVVVRAGQAWAGQSGLTAMQTAYVCNVGVSCATSATDFYRMDADGLRYFGGMGASADGTAFSMVTFASPEWVLRNPVAPGSMMGGALGGYASGGTWSAGVACQGNLFGERNFTSTYQAVGLETITTPAGTFANALHIREQRGSGQVRDVWYAPGVGIVRHDDADASAVLSGYTMPGGGGPPAGTMAAWPFMPAAGLWWNPDESGSGYHIQMQHGVLVATILSYSAAGDPVWYLGIGRPAGTGTGITVTGSLDRYRDGQCIACSYRTPAAAGSDGTFTMVFTSPTEASVQLPGGRVTRIRPMAW